MVRICVVLKSSVGHVQQLMAVQNVDLVKAMLDQAFTFALLAMANVAQFEYTHHGIRALHGKQPHTLIRVREGLRAGEVVGEGRVEEVDGVRGR